MSIDKGPLAESDEKLKELDEMARAVLIDVIEKGCLNFMDVANILSQLAVIDTTRLIKDRQCDSGCANGCNGGCHENCPSGCLF